MTTWSAGTISIPHGPIEVVQVRSLSGMTNLFQFLTVRLKLKRLFMMVSSCVISIPHGPIEVLAYLFARAIATKFQFLTVRLKSAD